MIQVKKYLEQFYGCLPADVDKFALAHFVYSQALTKVKDKIEALIERYGAIAPKGETQLNFKTARLIGYKDVLHFVNELLSEEETDAKE